MFLLCYIDRTNLGFAGIQMKDSVGTLIRSLATCNVALR